MCNWGPGNCANVASDGKPNYWNVTARFICVKDQQWLKINRRSVYENTETTELELFTCGSVTE